MLMNHSLPRDLSSQTPLACCSAWEAAFFNPMKCPPCMFSVAWQVRMQAGLVGSKKAHTGEEVQVQVHSGYDVWEADVRAPDFTGCTAKSCHAKSIIRPLGVDVMNVHHFERPAAGARCCSAPMDLLL